MEQTQVNLEPFFTKNIKLMHVFAQYRPETKWPLVIKLIYYLWRIFIYFCFTSTLFFTTMDIFINGFVQISDVAMHILNLFIYTSIWIRSLYFMYSHKTVEYLIKRLNEVMKESSTFAFTPFTMQDGRRISDKGLIMWHSLVLASGLMLAISAFVQPEKVLPLPMWLFYDSTVDIYFYPTFILQTFAQVFMVCCFANIEMFNICIHILLTHQFRLLGYDVKYLIPNVLYKCNMSQDDVKEFIKNPENTKLVKMVANISETKQFQDGVIDNFKVCIKHHQKLLSYRIEFYKFISTFLIIEVNMSFAYMIFTLFNLVTTEDKSLIVPMAQYTFAMVAQLFIIMFFGERLTNEVEDLRTTFHNIPWYICGKKFTSNFKFTQLRMARNDYLKAGKLQAISLETYLELMKKAFSFLAVLRQVNTQ